MTNSSADRTLFSDGGVVFRELQELFQKTAGRFGRSGLLLESIEVAGADNLRCVTFRSPYPQTVPAGEPSARDGLALRT